MQRQDCKIFNKPKGGLLSMSKLNWDSARLLVEKVKTSNESKEEMKKTEVKQVEVPKFNRTRNKGPYKAYNDNFINMSLHLFNRSLNYRQKIFHTAINSPASSPKNSLDKVNIYKTSQPLSARQQKPTSRRSQHINQNLSMTSRDCQTERYFNRRGRNNNI